MSPRPLDVSRAGLMLRLWDSRGRDALQHELTAVNQYWLHYRLIDNWGMNELGRNGARNPLRRCATPTRWSSVSAELRPFFTVSSNCAG